MTRWDAFSTDELRALDRGLAVDDQEYGCLNAELWQELRDELLCREFPDPVVRERMVDWSAAISEDQRRFPSPFERMLRDSYAPAIRASLVSGRLSWLGA